MYETPGMILQAAEQYGLDPARSWMVGDSEGDVEAGHQAGCKTIRVCLSSEKTKADFRVEHIDEVASVLERELGSCV